MTVPVQDPEVAHTGNGVTTVFAYPFLLYDAADMIVRVGGSLAVLNVDYTVSGLSNPAGGNVTFTLAPGSGVSVIMQRSMPLSRATDYQYSGDFQSPTVNRDFDRTWMALQDTKTAADRALRLPIGDTASTDLPDATARALKGLAFDVDGNPIAAASSDATTLAAILASPSAADTGGGIVGYDAAKNYVAGTLGKGVKDAAADAATALGTANTANTTANAATTNINTYKADVADTASAVKGAALMGFNYALGYGAGTIGKWLKDLATSAGAGLIGFLQSGTGAVLRTLQARLLDTVSAKDFGAAGNNATDDTAALQAAINYLQSIGGGTLHLPRGTYLISSELSVTAARIDIRGAGRGATIIKQTTANANNIRVSGGAGVQEYFTCCHMGFTNSNATPTGGAGIYLNDAPFSNLHDLSFINLYIGIRVQSGYLSKAQDFDMRDMVSSGLLIQQTNDFFARNFGIITTSTARHALAAVRIEDFAEAIVLECGEIVGGQRSLSMDASAYTAGSRPAYNRFSNIYFDSGELSSAINNSVLCNFDGCWFSGGRSGSGTQGLLLQQTTAINFTGCSFFNCGLGGCLVSATAVRARFVGCDFISNGAVATPNAVGLNFSGGCGNFTVQSCTFANGLYSGNQEYGMVINGGTSNNVTVIGNDFVSSGTTSGFLNGSTGAQQFISNNRV